MLVNVFLVCDSGAHRAESAKRHPACMASARPFCLAHPILPYSCHRPWLKPDDKDFRPYILVLDGCGYAYGRKNKVAW